MISGSWLLIRHFSGHLPEKKGLCCFILSALSRLTYLLLHRLLLSTFQLPPFYFPPYSLPLLSLFLSPSLLTPSLLITFYFPPYSLLLPSLPLTPYSFSPYSIPAFSSNLSTSHCSCWAMVSCPLSSSMASSALRNGLTSR